MAPSVTLYLVRISPSCRIVWLYLLQNKIPHELVDITSMDDLKTIPDIEDLTGHTDLPILTDGEIVVFEAPAILEYLAKTYTDHAGFGKTLPVQTKCSSILSWANSDIHRTAGYMYAYPQFIEKYRLETEEANERMIESGIEAFTIQLSKIEHRYLNRTPFLCGSEMTIADSFMVTTFLQSQWGGFNVTMWPKIRTWITKVMNQPHWKEVHAAHMEFVKGIIVEEEL